MSNEIFLTGYDLYNLSKTIFSSNEDVVFRLYRSEVGDLFVHNENTPGPAVLIEKCLTLIRECPCGAFVNFRDSFVTTCNMCGKFLGLSVTPNTTPTETVVGEA